MIARRYAESSTSVRRPAQHASVAFQNRFPSAFGVPSGIARSMPWASVAAARFRYAAWPAPLAPYPWSNTTRGAGSLACGGSWRSYGRAATSAASAAVGARVAVSGPVSPSRFDTTPSATVVVVDLGARSAALDDPEQADVSATIATSSTSRIGRIGRAFLRAGGAAGMPRSGSTTGAGCYRRSGP